MYAHSRNHPGRKGLFEVYFLWDSGGPPLWSDPFSRLPESLFVILCLPLTPLLSSITITITILGAGVTGVAATMKMVDAKATVEGLLY